MDDEGVSQYKCCSYTSNEPIKITPKNIVTNKTNVGSSFEQAKFGGKVRKLTEGEIRMAKRFYSSANGNSIVPYTAITIRQGGLGDMTDRAVTKNGESIHWPSSSYEDDFSKASFIKQGTFIHEMAHIWQYHCGGWVALNSFYNQGLGGAYEYDLQHLLGFYNVEQQATMIQDYYALRYFGVPDPDKLAPSQEFNEQTQTVSTKGYYVYRDFCRRFIKANNLVHIYNEQRYLYEAALEPYKKSLHYFLMDPSSKLGYIQKS